MSLEKIIPLFLAVLCSPFLFGVITRVKAIAAGRKGAPLLQPYYDILKLLRRGTVYSTTTSFVFRICPVAGLSAVIIAVLMLPLGGLSPLISFQGDIILFVYLLGIARFLLIIGALDTGSAFEGMGASREAFFSFLAEPVLFITLSTLAKVNHEFTLNQIVSGSLSNYTILILLITAALFIILLSENSRIPVDDPNTHLELTMIHEVMVLDYSGPEFGLILYTSALKLWVFCALVVQILLPFHLFNQPIRLIVTIAAVIFCSVLVGIIESGMARLRLLKVPQLLTGAGALAAIAFMFSSGGAM